MLCLGSSSPNSDYKYCQRGRSLCLLSLVVVNHSRWWPQRSLIVVWCCSVDCVHGKEKIQRGLPTHVQAPQSATFSGIPVDPCRALCLRALVCAWHICQFTGLLANRMGNLDGEFCSACRQPTSLSLLGIYVGQYFKNVLWTVADIDGQISNESTHGCFSCSCNRLVRLRDH